MSEHTPLLLLLAHGLFTIEKKKENKLKRKFFLYLKSKNHPSKWSDPNLTSIHCCTGKPDFRSRFGYIFVDMWASRRFLRSSRPGSSLHPTGASIQSNRNIARLPRLANKFADSCFDSLHSSWSFGTLRWRIGSLWHTHTGNYRSCWHMWSSMGKAKA
jgi:hypothetical protein